MQEVKLENFSPVKLADRDTIRPLLLAEDVCFCEYNFANLFMWGDIYQTRWLLQEDRLWLYNGNDDLMLMPVGRALDMAGLLAVSDGMRRAGKSGNFVLVDPDFVRENPGLGEFFRMEADPDNGDYIYLTQKLVDLKGNKLHKKRNQISQFQALYPGHQALPLQKNDLAACFSLAEKWCRLRTCEELDFTHETSALQRAMHFFEELGLQGVKITHQGEFIAFSIFSPLNHNMADVHFEKFDPEVKGSGQVINWETARALAGTAKYINREQDLGIEGLRQAKRSYAPEYVLNAYFLGRKP
ncbi:MAG: phosphatidylglycerol lysyltransferase domain-containing protein [Acidobacteria bacterium]|nr:phosphatidylglycerol lysyltransferase domain-containing protein [Acidobacteriota bacterium]